MKNYPGEQQPDLQWMKKMTKAHTYTFYLIQEIAYGVYYDPSVRTAVKYNKSAEEMMGYIQIKEKIDQIKKTLQEEKDVEEANRKAQQKNESPSATPLTVPSQPLQCQGYHQSADNTNYIKNPDATYWK